MLGKVLRVAATAVASSLFSARAFFVLDVFSGVAGGVFGFGLVLGVLGGSVKSSCASPPASGASGFGVRVCCIDLLG